MNIIRLSVIFSAREGKKLQTSDFRLQSEILPNSRAASCSNSQLPSESFALCPLSFQSFPSFIDLDIELSHDTHSNSSFIPSDPSVTP